MTFYCLNNCCSDLRNFANFQPSASNFKSFSQSLEHFFLTVVQNNFGKKIQFKLYLQEQLIDERILKSCGHYLITIVIELERNDLEPFRFNVIENKPLKSDNELNLHFSDEDICKRLVHVLLSRFYSDFILILYWFYPDFILILSRFYPDFIQIFFKTHFIQILSRFYPNFWKYLDKIRIKSG